MKVYIASPFFNEQELSLVKNIESELSNADIQFFSPRLEGGIIKNMTKEEKEKSIKSIYQMNVDGIDESDAVIAVIDNFDAGTMFEIGYATKANKTIITVTNNNYGLNVMLSEPVKHHTNSAKDAVAALLGGSFIELKQEVIT